MGKQWVRADPLSSAEAIYLTFRNFHSFLQEDLGYTLGNMLYIWGHEGGKCMQVRKMKIASAI